MHAASAELLQHLQRPWEEGCLACIEGEVLLLDAAIEDHFALLFGELVEEGVEALSEGEAYEAHPLLSRRDLPLERELGEGSLGADPCGGYPEAVRRDEGAVEVEEDGLEGKLMGAHGREDKPQGLSLYAQVVNEALILSTWSFALEANRSAWPPLAAGGASLDAVEEVCRHVEENTDVDSVGQGGLPDAAGRVTLDACVMLSPAQSGSVCAVSTHPHVTSIARAVMERSPHKLLAGAGAERFAAEHGFEARELLTDEARATYESWLADADSVGPQNIDPSLEEHHDTVGSLALDASGVLAAACSTSGMRFKTPGRVGDSPVPGHGIWVHPEHGACVATGSGELMMGSNTAFLAVEEMRRGAEVTDALRRAIERTAEEHQLGPEDQVALLGLRPDGGWAAMSLRPGFRAVLSTGGETDLIEPVALLSH